MEQWKRSVNIIILAGVLLALFSCGAWKPLFTKEEVLSELSERYGAEFVILETINNCEYRTGNKTIRCRLYLAAPSENQEQAFWVHSTLGKYWGGDSLPMRYSRGVSDTYAFDYFVERFDALLAENEINHFFRAGSTKIDIAEYLENQHLQGGGFIILITQETAKDIVTKVLEIQEQIADEYPLSSYLDYFSHPAYMPIRLMVAFCDKDYVVADGELVSSACFMPYDKKYDEHDTIVYRDTVETILEKIDKTIYSDSTP